MNISLAPLFPRSPVRAPAMARQDWVTSLRQALAQRRQRRDIRLVLERSERYAAAQPGFAADLRAAALRQL